MFNITERVTGKLPKIKKRITLNYCYKNGVSQNYWMMKCSFLIPLIGNDIGTRRKVGSYVMLCLDIVLVHQINNSVAYE